MPYCILSDCNTGYMYIINILREYSSVLLNLKCFSSFQGPYAGMVQQRLWTHLCQLCCQNTWFIQTNSVGNGRTRDKDMTYGDRRIIREYDALHFPTWIMQLTSIVYLYRTVRCVGPPCTSAVNELLAACRRTHKRLAPTERSYDIWTTRLNAPLTAANDGNTGL